MGKTSRNLTVLLACLVAFGAAGQSVVYEPAQSLGLGTVRTLAVMPEDRGFVTAGQSGVFVWSWQEPAPTRRWDQPSQSSHLATLAAGGNLLLTAGPHRVIRSRDLDSGLIQWEVSAHRAEITALATSQDGQWLATSSADNTVGIRRVQTGEMVRELVVPRTWIHAVAFSPDGAHVATAEGLPDEAVRLWNLHTGEEVRRFVGHTNEARAVAFLPDGHLVTAGVDRTVRVWDSATGAEVEKLMGASEALYLLAINTDGALVAAGGGGTMHVWAPAEGALLRTIQAPANLTAMAFVPGTNHLLVADAENDLSVWDPMTGTVLHVITGHTGEPITDMDFAPNGEELVAGGVERWSRVWDLRTGQPVTKFGGSPGGTSTAIFSPDGRWVLTDLGAPVPTARLWNRQNQTLEREFKGHTGWLLAGAFSEDSARIVTGATDGTARVWDLSTGALIRNLGQHGAWVTAVRFSSDGQWVATGDSNGGLRFWDSRTGAPGLHFEGEAGKIVSIRFFQDRVMTAAEGGLVQVRRLPEGEVVREIGVMTGFLNQAVPSPDGTLLLAAEGWPNFVASLWDIETGERLRVLAGHTSPVESVAFSPSGRWVATGADRIRIWSVADLSARLRWGFESGAWRLAWGLGTLQAGPSPQGPWEDVPGASSPWTVPADGPMAFFRVRVPGPF